MAFWISGQGVMVIPVMFFHALPLRFMLWAAAPGGAVPMLPDLNAKMHPGDSAPWTILFVLTAITLLPSLVMAIP